jgi:hypothetical protein
MLFLPVLEWDVLRHEILVLARFAVIVGPAMDGGELSRPVAVDMLHRRGPFEGVGLPGVLGSGLSPENAIEEIVEEKELTHGP